MLKWLQRITLILFALMFTAYIGFSVMDRIVTDKTIPEIALETEELLISVKDKKEKLLTGVTAFDKKDGDITSKVLVESVSKFIEPGVFNVTYAVSDNDNNVSKAIRRVRYTDYTQPEFYMKRALVYSVDEEVDIRAAVGARDCVDGDISDKVTIAATDFVQNTAGVFTVSLQVSNSMGHMIYLDVTVHVEGNETMAPEIQLEKSLGIDVLRFKDPEKNINKIIRVSALKPIFAELKNDYDLVLVDTPPCGVISDASIIAGAADAIIYIVRQDAVMQTEIRTGISAMLETDTKILGCILNGATGGPGGYGNYYKYGGYNKYYRYGYSRKYGYGYGDKNKK